MDKDDEESSTPGPGRPKSTPEMKAKCIQYLQEVFKWYCCQVDQDFLVQHLELCECLLVLPYSTANCLCKLVEQAPFDAQKQVNTELFIVCCWTTCTEMGGYPSLFGTQFNRLGYKLAVQKRLEGVPRGVDEAPRAEAAYPTPFPVRPSAGSRQEDHLRAASCQRVQQGVHQRRPQGFRTPPVPLTPSTHPTRRHTSQPTAYPKTAHGAPQPTSPHPPFASARASTPSRRPSSTAPTPSKWSAAPSPP